MIQASQASVSRVSRVHSVQGPGSRVQGVQGPGCPRSRVSTLDTLQGPESRLLGLGSLFLGVQVDRLEDELVGEQERQKGIAEELEQTFAEMSGY